MKRLTNFQLRVIIALNLVVIFLLTGFFFFPPLLKASTENTVPEHNRIRTGEISLNPALKWELLIGGEGDDEVVAAYEVGGDMLVLGNGSGGLDFDYSGVFAALIDKNGITKGFLMLTEEGSGDLLKSTCRAEGGFLLAIEGDSPYLILINGGGEVIKRIDGFLNAKEEVVEVKYYADGYFMLTNPVHALTGVKKLRCVYFSPTLNFVTSNLADSVYSLNVVESVVISGMVTVFCSAVSSLNTLPAAVEFPQTGSARVYMIKGADGNIVGFSVFSLGFYLLSENNNCSVLVVSYEYELVSKINISQHKPLSLKHANGYYYIFCEGGVYVLDSNRNIGAVLLGFSPSNFMTVGGSLYACGAEALSTNLSNRVGLNIYEGGEFVRGFDLGEGFLPIGFYGEGGMFCIFNTLVDGVVFVKIVALRDSVF